MFICPNCFSDIELRSHIESLSQKTGHCGYCESDAVPLLEIVELMDFFEELITLYQEDDSGIQLIEKIKIEWKLFSESVDSQKLLTNILTLTSHPGWKSDTLVSFINDVEENISYWHQLKNSLKWEQRFLINIENLKDLEWDRYFKDQISFNDDVQFFRARIHHSEKMAKLPTTALGPPEKEKVYGGRGNPQGIPYLYLSKQAPTTLYETRALLHDEVSVGRFKVLPGERLDIVDFTETGSAFRGIGNLLSHTKAVRLKALISKDLSKPIRRYDSDIEYIPTQFICEFIRYIIGADGIMFKSSLHPDGENLVLFSTDKVECVEVNKYKVIGTEIDYEEIS